MTMLFLRKVILTIARFTEIERSLHKSQPEMFVICMCSIKQRVLGGIYQILSF